MNCDITPEELASIDGGIYLPGHQMDGVVCPEWEDHPFGKHCRWLLGRTVPVVVV